MLPGTHGLGIAHPQRLATAKGADRVRHDAVGRPVAGPDDIARAGRGQLNPTARGKKRGAVRGRHQLLAALRGAVGIMPAHRIVLAVGVILLAVFVALVAGDHHHGTGVPGLAHGLQHMRRAAHVGVHRLDRLRVRPPHQRLRRQMKHRVGTKFPRQRRHPLPVPDVRRLVPDQRGQIRAHKRAILRLGLQPDPQDLRAQPVQPERQPRAFEPRVARQPDAPAAIHPLTLHVPNLLRTMPGACRARRIQRRAGAQTGDVPGTLTRRMSSSSDVRSSHSCCTKNE